MRRERGFGGTSKALLLHRRSAIIDVSLHHCVVESQYYSHFIIGIIGGIIFRNENFQIQRLSSDQVVGVSEGCGKWLEELGSDTSHLH